MPDLEAAYVIWRELPFPKLHVPVRSTPALVDMYGDLALVDLWIAETLIPYVRHGVVNVPRVDVRAGLHDVQERAAEVLRSFASSDDFDAVEEYVGRQVRYVDALSDVYEAFLARNGLAPNEMGRNGCDWGFQTPSPRSSTARCPTEASSA